MFNDTPARKTDRLYSSISPLIYRNTSLDEPVHVFTLAHDMCAKSQSVFAAPVCATVLLVILRPGYLASI